MKLDRPLKHQLAGGTAALAATLPIVAGASPLIAAVSALSLTGGLGYALASFLLSSWCRSTERRLNEAQMQFAEYQEMERTRLKAERKVIAAEGERLKAEIYKAREVARLAESVLKDQYDAEIEAAKGQLKASFDQGLQDRITQLEAEKVARVKHFRSQHLQRERALITEIIDLRKQLDQKTALLKEEFDKAIPAYKRNNQAADQPIAAQQGVAAEVNAEAQAADAKPEEKFAEVNAEAQAADAKPAEKATEQRLREQIQQLQDEIARLKAPKRYRRSTDHDRLGNQILDFYQERGVLLEGEGWSAQLSQVEFYLWPLPEVKAQAVTALLDELQSHLGVDSTPTAVEVDGYIKLGIPVAAQTPAEQTPAEQTLTESRVESPVLREPAPVTISRREGGEQLLKKAVQRVQVQPKPVTAAPARILAGSDLETLLAQGTHCPKCGHHSARYHRRKPNARGNVSVKCLNPACVRKTFQWQVV
jgi:hypothetical protein